MIKIPYVVFTRFNIAVNYKAQKSDTYVPDKPWLDEKYLSRRFEIFEKYTFPSLKGQSNQDFTWIVLFHQDTPDKYKEKISGYKALMKNFEPWFLNDEESFKALDLMSGYVDKLREDFKSEVITTRVDNDDIIHKDYVKVVRENLENCTDYKIFSFENGLSYSIINDFIGEFNDNSNHFLSMISGKCDYNHILNAGSHDAIIKNTPIDHIMVVRTKIPMWIELISDTNCANRLRWGGIKQMFIPYETLDEYSMLSRVWNGRLSYLKRMIEAPIIYYIEKRK